MGGMSQNIQSIFRLPWHCTSLHVPPTSVVLCAKTASCAGHTTSLHTEQWVTGLRGRCLLPFRQHGEHGLCEHEGAIPAFDGWTVCQ